MGKDNINKIEEKYIITAALPYANGPVHVGHFGGVYLPADIYYRYLKKKDKDVIFICGTDEHGVPITLASESRGVHPSEIVKYYHRQIKESFKKLGVEFDNFSGTSREVHHRLSQDFFMTLYNKGFIESQTTKELYCPECKRFLPDRYVEGTCPKCGFEEARGDSCESCGSWLEPGQLIDPRCKICGSKPQKKETKHWYLTLDKFQEKLENWLKNKKWKKTVKKYLLGWLKEGLKPRPITRDLEWGVKVPLEDAENKVLYVWFDAPLGYISSTIEWANNLGKPDLWKEYWKDDDTTLIHFLGKDNIVFHGIIWPAVLMGYGNYTLPSEIPANEYVNLEGEKISTSRNWAVWLNEYVEEFEPDFLRYYLSLISPETRDSDFKWEEFQERVNKELINNIGNFVNRTLKFIDKYFEGSIPEPGPLNSSDKELINETDKLIAKIDNYLSNFKVKEAIKSYAEISGLANRYYDSMEPWATRKKDTERTATTLYLCSHIISVLASVGEIFIPFGSGKMLDMMNLKSKKWDELNVIDIPGNHRINNINPLYNRIEDDEIERQIRRLKMSYIGIDDFKKMGLKVGLIKEVNDIQGADKLYKLTVDTGEERTLVAGLKEHYTKDELEGRSIIVLTNLEPATIMGVRSEGMLLAATEGDTVSIISPDAELKPGSEIS